MTTKRKDLLVGQGPSGPVYLTAQDRSTHVLVMGAIGSGKTHCIEGFAHQDMDARRPFAFVDVQGRSYDNLVEHASRLNIRPVLVDLSDDWVTPFNPFQRNGDAVSVQVERRTRAVYQAWGAETGDQSPRLEKILRSLFTVIIEKGLTMLEAPLILREAKEHPELIGGLPDSLVSSQLEEIFSLPFTRFFDQTESTMNRLMRFGPDTAVGRMLGVGTNAIDIPRIMNEGGVLLIKMPLSHHVSRIQQKTLAALLLNEIYESAMQRQAGARPFYLYLDEAGEFATPDLADALNHARQKGLHVTLALQHLAQLKHDPLLYKSVKNSTLTKIIFRTEDREDALELAGDLFPDLAKPEVKHVHERRAFAPRTEYLETFSAGVGRGESEAETEGTADTFGTAVTKGSAHTRSRSHTDSGGESHSSADTTSRNWQESETKGETETESHSSTHGKKQGLLDGLYFWADKEPHVTSTESEGGSTSKMSSRSKARGGSESHTNSVSSQRGWADTTGDADTDSMAFTASGSRTKNRAYQRGTNRSENASIGLTPATVHDEYVEKKSQLYTLEERRWNASDLLMGHGRGQATMKSPGQFVALSTPGRKKPFTNPGKLLSFKERVSASYGHLRDDVDQKIRERHRRLLAPPEDDDSPKPSKRPRK